MWLAVGATGKPPTAKTQREVIGAAMRVGFSLLFCYTFEQRPI